MLMQLFFMRKMVCMLHFAPISLFVHVSAYDGKSGKILSMFCMSQNINRSIIVGVFTNLCTRKKSRETRRSWGKH